AADRWGEIPFTEANDVENLNPSFDEPTVIYNGIIALIDEALALVDLNNQQEPFTIVNSDPLFNGDMERWQRFANSLKLRVLMRISSVEDVSAQISALLTSGVPFVESNSQNVEFRYFADRTNQNFDFATFDNFTNLNSYQLDGGIRRHQRWRRGANGLVDLLNTLGDPRRFSYFDRDLSFETTPPPADPETPVDFFDRTAPLVGSPNGASAQPDPEDRCYTSLFFIRQDKSDEWLTAAEHNLLAAEAYARGLAPGGLTAAQTAMEAGIRASMTQFDGFTYEGKNYEIPDEEIDDYIDALPELTTLTADEALEVIQEQQYIALFNNGQEAWSNWRRTKVPDLQVPIGAPIITVISRIELPNDELRANSNAPSVTPRIDEPVYFEKPRQ
ncbi:MAG: SusD/RagB family nutrient-binding outer membrane lipoprotein, partial [Bacteroidota bacterium]